MTPPTTTESLAVRFAPSIEGLQEFFSNRSLPYGEPSDIFGLVERLSHAGPFRDEMRSMLRAIIYREGGVVPRLELLEVVGLAIGGPGIDDAADELHLPAGQLLTFVGEVIQSLQAAPAITPEGLETPAESAPPAAMDGALEFAPAPDDVTPTESYAADVEEIETPGRAEEPPRAAEGSIAEQEEATAEVDGAAADVFTSGQGAVEHNGTASNGWSHRLAIPPEAVPTQEPAVAAEPRRRLQPVVEEFAEPPQVEQTDAPPAAGEMPAELPAPTVFASGEVYVYTQADPSSPEIAEVEPSAPIAPPVFSRVRLSGTPVAEPETDLDEPAAPLGVKVFHVPEELVSGRRTPSSLRDSYTLPVLGALLLALLAALFLHHRVVMQRAEVQKNLQQYLALPAHPRASPASPAHPLGLPPATPISPANGNPGPSASVAPSSSGTTAAVQTLTADPNPGTDAALPDSPEAANGAENRNSPGSGSTGIRTRNTSSISAGESGGRAAAETSHSSLPSPSSSATHSAEVSRGYQTTPRGQFAVSSGMMSGNVVAAPLPVYPKLARLTHVQGEVILQAVVSRRGRVIATHVVRGHRLLRGAAEDAVRRWRYRPYTVNGRATDIATIISIEFRLPH